MSGHTQITVVAGAHHIQSAPLHMLAAVRSQSGGSARARNSAHLQDGQERLQQERQRMDAKVCDGVEIFTRDRPTTPTPPQTKAQYFSLFFFWKKTTQFIFLSCN